ncbi:histidine--tRNA ligase [Mycoplasmopsis columbinasalis]|uniref:Histidine--tRNA ligase n=1 Tax=Mycoplasmopsis columbinasalis TaxID=114880 RepID=A0A449B9U9_9BACT|nr:histidine--tRNA ligase [Mycoplasmopsis columbinasalis]VEU77950.1 Histidyl-tRNA synthetase [Mycoplasmopsis columbinasalis]
MEYKRIKGTRDICGREARVQQYLKTLFFLETTSFGCDWIELPILESAELFRRNLETSDIVKKEMYEFEDKGKRKVTLRPEGTAGFVRAFVENKWYADTTSFKKFAYLGPMFRYEQPQKGRYRQFNQAGVEFLCDKNPFNDAEIIIFAYTFLQKFTPNIKLKLNSLGDNETRAQYQQALKNYLTKHKKQLSPLSQERLETNVLRILDDKVDSKLEIMDNAPKLESYLTPNSKAYFEKLKTILAANGIDFEQDDKLVRGLDYYDEVVFEIVSQSDQSGSQNTLIGGGRYSNLVSELGGPQLSACGFALGVDRLVDLLLEEETLPFVNSHLFKVHNQSIDLLMFVQSESDLDWAFKFVFQARKESINIELIKDTGLKTKKIFERANRYQIHNLIFFDSFASTNTYLYKNTQTNAKVTLDFNNVDWNQIIEMLKLNIKA